MKRLMQTLMQTFVGVVLVALIIALLSIRAEASQAAASVPECSLKGEGIVTDAWVKHRIFVGDEPIFGANDMDAVSTHLKELRHAGVCR